MNADNNEIKKNDEYDATAVLSPEELKLTQKLLPFQKQGGPFFIRMTNGVDQTGIIDIQEVYEQGKLVKEFNTSIDAYDIDDSPLMEYVANRLIRDYPNLLDRDKYLTEDTPFTKSVTVKEILTTLRQERQLIEDKIAADLQNSKVYLQEAGLPHLIEELVPGEELVAENVISRFLKSEFQVENLESISPMEISKKIAENRTALNNKIENVEEHMLNIHIYSELNQDLSHLKELEATYNQYESQNYQLSVVGSVTDYQNIVKQLPHIDRQISELHQLRETNIVVNQDDEITIPFQNYGGPFRLASVYHDTGDERYDTVNYYVFKDNQLVKEYRFAALDEEGGADAYSYIAKELSNNFPQFLDQEKLQTNTMNYQREVPVSQIKHQLQVEMDGLKTEIVEFREIIVKRGFLNLVGITDSQIIEDTIRKQYLQFEDTRLKELTEFHKNQAEVLDREMKAFNLKEKPGVFNYFKRRDYLLEEKNLKIKSNLIDTLKSNIDDLQNKITEKTIFFQPEIRKIAYEIEKANMDIVTDRFILKQVEDLYASIPKTDKDYTVALSGSYYDITYLLDNKTDIVYQIKDQIENDKNKLERNKELKLSSTEAIEIPIQKKGGPFSAITYAENESVICELSENGKIVQTFDVPYEVRWHNDPPMLNHVAIELATRYPNLIDQEQYKNTYHVMTDGGRHLLQFSPDELSKIVIESKRLERIKNYVPSISQKGSPVQEYMRHAKLHLEKGANAGSDKLAVQSMLKKGFSKEAIIKTLTKYSPEYSGADAKKLAKEFVRNIAKMPTIKKSLTESYSR